MLLQFGFPLGFNHECELKHDKQNHKSAFENLKDIDVYLKDKIQHGAIEGPFDQNPTLKINGLSLISVGQGR